MTKPSIVEKGARFGRWVVNGEGPRPKGKRRTINCVCECGAVANVYLSHLAAGKSKGCLRCAVVTHDMAKTPTWISWSAMRARCSLPSHEAYARYGGRGISVCERWSNFEAFYADMSERPKGKTIDRINTDGNYEKSNCQWATPNQQANNTSWNRVVVYHGKEYSVAQLAEHTGMNYHTLVRRLNHGIDIDAPLRKAKTPHAKRPSKIKSPESTSEGGAQEEMQSMP